MHRSLVLLVAAVLAFTLSAEVEPPKADEKWITFETDGVRFISSASPRVTLAIGRDLLRMRAAVAQVTRLRVQTLFPTRVYIFSSERSSRPYLDAVLDVKTDWFTGVFLRRPGGNFILVRSDVDSDRVFYHELTHQFVSSTAGNLPAWFDEGIAEYYSTFRTVEDAAHIGRPVGDHVLDLRDQPLIPLREFFAVTRSSPIYNEGKHTGRFYAQSWALVHYLMTDPDRRARLARFLTLLGDGKSVDDAFSGAFGIQMSEVEKALRAYVRRVSFQYDSYKLADLAIAEVPEPVPMPRDVVLQQLGELLMTSARNTTSAKRLFDEALALNPGNALAYTGLGRVHDAAGRTADADAAYAKAVQLGSRDAEVHLATGWSLWARRPNPESYRRVRASFERATEVDPRSSRAWAALGSLYLKNDRERATAIAAFRKSVALDPANDEASHHLIRLLARDGRGDEARKVANAMHARTRERSARTEVTVMLAEVDRFETATDLSASLHEAMEKADTGKYDEALAILDRLLPTIRDPAIEEQTRAFREQVAGTKAKKK